MSDTRALPCTAEVYRFRDRVAVNPPGAGGTFYLTPKSAKALAKALNAAARDCLAVADFAASDFPLIKLNLNRE